MKRIPLTLALTLSVFGAALAAPQVGRKETSTKKVDLPPGLVKKLMTVADYFESLPRMQDIPETPTKIEKKETKKDTNFTVTTYSLKSTPSKFVSMGEVPGLWLGALVTEDGIRSGGSAVHEIFVSEEKRAPLEISLSTLGSQNSAVVQEPTAGKVRNKIGELIGKAIKERKTWGEKSPNFSEAYSYESIENSNVKQAAIKLGLNVKYMAADVAAGLDVKKSSGQHTLTVSFVERAFTVTARPGIANSKGIADRWVTSKYTTDDIAKMKLQDAVSAKNLPCYVSSVSYGRRLIFNLTSRFSASYMKATLDASYNGAVTKVKGKAEIENLLKDSETTITVAGQGGPSPSQIADLLLKGNLASYFNTRPEVGSFVPLSYAVRCVVGDAPVVVLLSDSFDERAYTGNAQGRRYQLTAYVKLREKPDAGNGSGEIYGEFRQGTERIWQWQKSNSGRGSQQKEKGDTINILSDTGTEYSEAASNTAGMTAAPFLMNCYEGDYPTWSFSGEIKDDDGKGSRDDYMGIFKFSISPRKIFTVTEPDGKGGKPAKMTTHPGFPEGKNPQFSTMDGKKVFTAEIPYSGKGIQDGASTLYIKITEVGGL